MPETFDEVQVEKHFKMKSGCGSIEMHCSESVVGFWLSSSFAGKDRPIGIVAERGKPPYICVYAKGKKLPFAIHGEGIQIPGPGANDSPTFLSFDELSILAKKAKESLSAVSTEGK
jgi:hypothetical protein